MDPGRRLLHAHGLRRPLLPGDRYCLGVEKLLGIEEDIPERASLIRILMMELCRIASHLVAIGSTGNEMGATTIMTIVSAAARKSCASSSASPACA